MDALIAAVEGLGLWIGLVLTIFVFSYLVHDSFLFRIASCLLVGTAVGFVGAVAVSQVILPLFESFIATIGTGDIFAIILALIPILLGVSLLLKLAPTVRGSSLSNFGMAYLFGIGAALAIGGALSGALVPQLLATMVSLAPQGDDPGWINNLLIVVGTLGAFLAFRFIQPGNRPYQRVYDIITNSWGTIGRAFIMIAFGAILATLIVARVSALVGQLYFIFHDVLGVIN